MFAEIIKDSINPEGKRITTFVVEYPRYIHGEVLTHRKFSRNAQSSRAIPVKKVLKQVWSNPVEPIVWLKNKPGMQATEPMTNTRKWFARKAWRFGAKMACVASWSMMKLGLHKQWANRVLEPFQSFKVIITSTEWDNFLNLRYHEDAQPEIYELAKAIKEELEDSTPTKLNYRQWHLPFITDKEISEHGIANAKKMSVARCARVSYLTHDKKYPTIEQDLNLFTRLVGSDPIHASPSEHQAYADRADIKGNYKDKHLHGNLEGWVQYRKLIEKGRI